MFVYKFFCWSKKKVVLMNVVFWGLIKCSYLMDNEIKCGVILFYIECDNIIGII